MAGNGNEAIRVLIVDTNPTRREALRENLSQERFEVYVAEGEGDALRNDALRQFMAHYCHVVVTVPRLVNPADPEDFSGLEMGPRFAPAGIVIYTPEPDDAVAYRAGWEHMGYLHHGESRQKLAAIIEDQARRRPFTIYWPQDDLEAHVASALRLDPAQVTLEDLRILLGQVFPKANGVALKPLPGMDTTMLAATPVRRAMVLWTQENRLSTNYLTPKVTKIGTRDRIEREVGNYNQFVESRLRQDRQARLEGHALLWHIGAIAYTFLGASPDELHSFRNYYTHNDPANVLAVLRQMFTHTCENWYGDQSDANGTPLYGLYAEALGLEEHLTRFDQTAYRLSFPGVAEDLPNPALWILREGREIDLPGLKCCVSHGDLHADNFFVDSSNLVWLIDFEQTGPAHVFRDFVELEADIKLRLTQFAPDDLPGVALLERALLAGSNLTSLLLPPPELLAQPSLYKAFQVISGIRHLAAIATGVDNLQEYNLALLYETMFMSTQNRLRETIKERARLSAALIVERLTRRTGLLSRAQGAAIPRLETARLQQPGAQTRQLLDAQQAYLVACFRSAELQAHLHPNGPPEELNEGLRAIQHEGQRLQRFRERLK